MPSPHPAGATAPTDDEDGGIGPRLRARRKVRGLSLQQVAGRADVSIGLLSQIERGLSMPSVRSLRAICAALEMPVGWLFDGDGTGPDDPVVVPRHRRRVLDLGAKGMVKEMMTPDACAGIQMMRIVIRPGGSSGETAYNHPEGAKCGTVLSGVLGLEVDGTTRRLEAGDSFAFNATSMLRFWAEGPEEAVVIWVISPAVY
ncbi:MAG: helix-turn-helix domain-containing protein [Alkalilacustris sp.]